MTKRFALWAALALLLSGLIFAASQAGIGQMAVQTAPQTPAQTPAVQTLQGRPQTQAPEVNPEELRAEIALLRLLGEMELSRDQLEALHGMVTDIQARRGEILQAQLELRDFLAGYQGSREDLAAQIEPYEEKIAQARKGFRETLASSVDRLKDLLTLKQGEILREFLMKRFARMPSVAPGEVRRDDDRPEIKRFWKHHKPDQDEAKGEGEIEIHIRGKGLRDGRSFESDYECDSIEKSMEEFGGRIEEWLKRWGIELDIEGLKELKRAPERRQELWRNPWKARICLRAPSMWLIDRGLLERFLLERLDLLERVLSEKLERMSATQI
jgi:hypothetical protein